jgi:hypothetical protein
VVTISGDDSPFSKTRLTVADVRERDEYRSPKYRKYRGGEIPVFKDVPGLGLLDKGKTEWTAWVTLNPSLVSDMLVLLGSGSSLYLGLHERKEQRTRWVNSLTLQTTNPADE